MIKKLDKTELYTALSLVWKVFCEYEAINYPESGKQTFYDAIHSEDYLDMLTAYGYYENEKLIGIIATRNKGRHIALFFVDGEYHGQGIGRSLWNAVLTENAAESITVHSSLYAVKVYEKLGFIQTDGTKTDGGIRYVPMIYKVKER